MCGERGLRDADASCLTPHCLALRTEDQRAVASERCGVQAQHPLVALLARDVPGVPVVAQRAEPGVPKAKLQHV